ncbi:hypothetical protein HAX54_017770 [Datura stramonium]|uniref:Uncharacterized protein n=1 Tax=Datura stramonium TaxID=4076 RepID=A0ABS8UNG6_DATST|nr:hypothetical protein [Datura stramonium]
MKFIYQGQETLDELNTNSLGPSITLVPPDQLDIFGDDTSRSRYEAFPDEGPSKEPGTEFVSLPLRGETNEKESADLSGEHLFEGNLSDVKEDQSNILLSEAGVIEGFLNPWVKKEDGTLDTAVTATTSSPTPAGDDVPLNLVFSKGPRSSSKFSSKSKKTTKRRPVTRGKAKRSMDKILKCNHDETLKRARLVHTTVIKDEEPLSQLVELDIGDTSQAVEEVSVMGKKSQRGKGKSMQKKVMRVGRTAKEPDADDQGSKGEVITSLPSKGKKATKEGPGASLRRPSLDECLEEK